MKRNVSLIGFMGSGKSTVGREVSRITGLHLVDFDEEIEERSRMTVAEIFSRLGETYFRDLEFAVLKETSHKGKQLLVPGGGFVVPKRNRTHLLRASHVIWLRIGIDEVLRRMTRGDGREKRPLLAGMGNREDIATLLAGRERFYRECDDVIDVDGKEFAEVVDAVVFCIDRAGFIGTAKQNT